MPMHQFSKRGFTTKLPAMARIQFDDLKSLDSFSQVYQKGLKAHQEELETSERQWKGPQRLKQEADGQIQKARKNQSCREKHSSQLKSDQTSLKTIRLSGGPVQEIRPISPAREQVASQEKAHQAQEQLDQKKKD